jgi:hypothetical protein
VFANAKSCSEMNTGSYSLADIGDDLRKDRAHPVLTSIQNFFWVLYANV